MTLASAIGFAVAWFNANRRARRLESQLLGAGLAAKADATPDRTERMEEAVDALAAQVENLASGQEFLSRLLAERLDKLAARPVPAPQPRELVTPH